MTPLSLPYLLYIISLLGAGLIMLSLSLFNFFRRTLIGLAFGLVCFCCAVWMIGLAFLNLVPGLPAHLSRLFYIGVSFIPFSFTLLTVVFLKTKTRGVRFLLTIFAALSLLFAILSQTDMKFVREISHCFFGVHGRFGFVGKLFVIYYCLSLCLSIYFWFAALRHESDAIHRRRLLMIIIGFLIGMLAALDFLPCFGIHVYPFGYLFALGSCSFLSYAFYVYHAAPIEAALALFLRRFVLVLGMTLPMTAGVFVYRSQVDFMPYGLEIAVTMGFLGFLGVYFILGLPMLERIVFYRDNLRDNRFKLFLDDIVRLQNPAEFVQHLRGLLRDTLPDTHIALVVKKNESGEFKLWDDGQVKSPPASFQKIIPWLESHSEILNRYQVSQDPQFQTRREALLDLLSDLQAEVCIPLVQGESLQGLIGISSRRASNFPSASEIVFFKNLKPIVTMALNNSYLFEDVRQLSRDLMEANQTLNERVETRTMQLEDTLSQLQRLNQEQREFFTMASHTIRTPLTSIKAASILLWDKNPETQHLRVNQILQNNIRRLEILVSDIIEITKVSKGKLALNYIEVNLDQLIEDARQEVQWQYPHHAVEWNIHLDSDTRSLYADRQRIQEVLINLFSNAIKFGGAPCRVEVAVKMVKQEDLVKYDCAERELPDRFIEISISDNGGGIPEEEFAAIFEGFRQVTNSHKRYQGNGLGLFIVRQIVYSHGGVVTVRNNPDQGACFSFLLPA